MSRSLDNIDSIAERLHVASRLYTALAAQAHAADNDLFVRLAEKIGQNFVEKMEPSLTLMDSLYAVGVKDGKDAGATEAYAKVHDSFFPRPRPQIVMELDTEPFSTPP